MYIVCNLKHGICGTRPGFSDVSRRRGVLWWWSLGQTTDHEVGALAMAFDFYFRDRNAGFDTGGVAGWALCDRGHCCVCVSSQLMLAAKSAGRPKLAAAIDDGAPH